MKYERIHFFIIILFFLAVSILPLLPFTENKSEGLCLLYTNNT